jgi:hypothetical protein
VFVEFKYSLPFGIYLMFKFGFFFNLTILFFLFYFFFRGGGVFSIFFG